MGRIDRTNGKEKSLSNIFGPWGKAKKAALQLEMKVWSLEEVRGGVTKLKEKFDKAFSKDKKKATYDAYEKCERFKRSNKFEK